MDNENKVEEVELKEKRAMVYLPENSVDITITCKIYEDGKLITVEKCLRLSDIQAAFKDAEENYIGPDDKFQITEAGLEWLNEREKYENN